MWLSVRSTKLPCTIPPDKNRSYTRLGSRNTQSGVLLFSRLCTYLHLRNHQPAFLSTLALESIMSDQKQPLINNGGYRESLDEDLDPRYATESYQHQAASNNVMFDAASTVESQSQPRGGPAWQQPQQSFLQGGGGPSYTNSFGTSSTLSLSGICAAAWALPPFSSAVVLIWETENDLARFHAYQAGISGVALIVLLWILRTVLGLKTIGLLVGMGTYGWFWVNA